MVSFSYCMVTPARWMVHQRYADGGAIYESVHLTGDEGRRGEGTAKAPSGPRPEGVMRCTVGGGREGVRSGAAGCRSDQAVWAPRPCGRPGRWDRTAGAGGCPRPGMSGRLCRPCRLPRAALSCPSFTGGPAGPWGPSGPAGLAGPGVVELVLAPRPFRPCLFRLSRRCRRRSRVPGWRGRGRSPGRPCAAARGGRGGTARSAAWSVRWSPRRAWPGRAAPRWSRDRP